MSNPRSEAFKRLLAYWKKLVLKNTDNRMQIFKDLSVADRWKLDDEYVRVRSLIQRLSRLHPNPITPNRIFQ